MDISETIINNLIYDETYMREVLPHIKNEYFEVEAEKILIDIIKSFIAEYNKTPTKQVLQIELDNQTNISGELYTDVQTLIGLDYATVEYDWLLDSTEKWVKDRSLFLALTESIMIADGEYKDVAVGEIPDLLRNALNVSFDKSIGIDFINDADARHELYTNKEHKIPFDITELNKYTDGGIPKKTLNIVLSPTNGGKSALLAHHAADYLMQGKNVLFISLEMAEAEVMKRIDANILDISLNKLKYQDKVTFHNQVKSIKKKTSGNLIVKEYPTGTANVGHFRYLLNELKNKKDFVPDVICVDYVNIMSSTSIKMGGSVNSYTFIKKISEELRGFSTESDTLIWTASQLNRGAFRNNDAGLDDISDSFGIAQTADFAYILIRSDELDDLQQIAIKIAKNRFGSVPTYGFNVGMDWDKMRMINIENSDNNVSNPISTPEKKSKADFGEFKF